jgi:hypothetical protein
LRDPGGFDLALMLEPRLFALIGNCIRLTKRARNRATACSPTATAAGEA